MLDSPIVYQGRRPAIYPVRSFYTIVEFFLSLCLLSVGAQPYGRQNIQVYATKILYVNLCMSVS